MHPSCSVFAREAFARHGAVMGLAMTANRLFFREFFADAEEFQVVPYAGYPRLFDPPAPPTPPAPPAETP
jgi:hypothetical protein